jgi:bacillithiol synthase
MFKHQKVSIDKLPIFSKIFKDYLLKNANLQPFITDFPSIKAIENRLKTRQFSHLKRKILVETLNNQYLNIHNKDKTNQNIQSLASDHTFTITTGHQLCLLTGPLYFIFKIVSTINLAKTLQQNFPDYHFVPVFWMATEDHDVEEINHFYLFGKKFIWETTQKGAVGEFSTAELKSFFQEIDIEIPDFISNAYLHHTNLADATRQLVHELFGKEGLVIVDGDTKNFKQQFVDHIKSDLFEGKAFTQITETNQALEQLKYHTQINTREVNFFFLENQQRNRISKEQGNFLVHRNDTSLGNLTFNFEQIHHLIETEPEKFSPNVCLRPLFQEVILPNLAYIGGPGELAYWLQLKSLFDSENVDFPILMPRNFGMVVNKNQVEKAKKLKISIEDLLLTESELKSIYLQNNEALSLSTVMYQDSVNLIYEQIKEKALALDKSLLGFLEAQKAENHKILENILKKFKKSAETKEIEGINQLLSLQKKLFPDGGLQERKDNFLNFYFLDTNFIDFLIQNIDALDNEFNIFSEVDN